jgi:hypothetical protein
MKSVFAKYAVLEPVTHAFEKVPTYWWKIRSPTSGDELNLSRFTLQNRVIVGVDGVRREYPPTNTEVMHREVALTFGGTNLPLDETPVEEGGEPWVKVSSDVEVIEAQLRKMPHEMVLEIWEAVGQAVPGWGPALPKARRAASPTPSAA